MAKIISTEAEFLAQLKSSMKELEAEINDDRLSDGIEDAMSELKFVYPLSGQRRTWAVLRAIRHSLNIFINDILLDFDVDQDKLSQQYKHLSERIKDMDKSYESALLINPEVFGDSENFDVLGSVVCTESDYDLVGHDLNYGCSE